MFSFFSGPSWTDPDWRRRLKAANTKKDKTQLRRLALTDVSQEVRIAAVQHLDELETLIEVARSSTCLASRQLAISRVTQAEPRITLALDASLPDELRLLALNGLLADPRLLAAYRPDAAEPFKIAILDLAGDLGDEGFWFKVARSDTERKVRLRAMKRVGAEKMRATLAQTEPDRELRILLMEGVKSADLLQQLLNDEPQEPLRVWLAGRIAEPSVLARMAREDRNVEVRLIAIPKLTDRAVLQEIATSNSPAKAALAALARLTDDVARGTVAMTSPHEEVRTEALRLITDEAVLGRLEKESTQPEIRWLAGRQLGSMPLDDLARIQNGRTLRRLIERETEPEVATWLVSRVGDQETLRVLGGSTFPGVAAARRRLGERTGPLGLRFMPVPGRPYEMSLFPVTIGQLKEALGPAAAGPGADDLPAGMTPEIAKRFCEYLTTREKTMYRLPSFSEWRHACMADDDIWLDAATGQLSWAEALLKSQRIAISTHERRPAARAWPNPWGYLDMVGNVAVWVEDSPRQWLRLAAEDSLAAGGDPSKETDFNMAAGASWADPRVRKNKLERLVARAGLTGWAADKVGLRILCDQPQAMPTTTRYKLVLLPETMNGLSKEAVIAAIAERRVDTQQRAETWYRVAPAVVILSPQYNEIRRVKRVLEECGAVTQLTIVTG